MAPPAGHRWVSLAVALVLGPLAVAAESAGPSLDAGSAAQWQACTGWVGALPEAFSVAARDGSLWFSVDGAHREMPWLIDLKPAGITGDERYLLVRYRAEGLSTASGTYFLHGEEGSHGGLAYAMANQLQADGAWHTLAVDLAGIQPREPTHHLAVKVAADGAGRARLAIERLWFADALPGGARLAALPPQRPERTVAIDWQAAGGLQPQAGWTTSPAPEFSAVPEGKTVKFAVRGEGAGMRWLLRLPQAIELSRTPFLSLRYRASGRLGTGIYAIWLGTGPGKERKSAVALPGAELEPDGVWHRVTLKLNQGFVARELAVGLDSAGPEAGLVLDSVEFSSRPRRWPVAEVLPHEPRKQSWPDGAEGFHTVPAAAVIGGKPSAFLVPRLELDSWFASPHITAGGVPFEVPLDSAAVPHSDTAGFGALSLKWPEGAREIALLLAAAVPSTEPWGIDSAHPRKVEVLDVPEKVVFEIRYAGGPPDWVLPLDAATGAWGLKRGLSVSVVHPDPSRRATELLLHDRMQTGSFGVVAATFRRDAPRVREPACSLRTEASGASRPLAGLPPRNAPAPLPHGVVTGGALAARLDTREGLAWSGLRVPGLEHALSLAPGPLFEVALGAKVLPARDWQVSNVESLGGGGRYHLRHPGASLAAVVECLPGNGDELRLRMRLINEGQAKTTATLRFPVLRDLCLGSPAETHYLCGKRGGIIHSAEASFREPLGERHPLQMDGFFNPQSGLALACLTRDTTARHHWVNLAKTGRGGSWSVEYVNRDLAPGQSFEATEASLVLREGGWRGIFGAYREWLATWFKPAAPPKPWFEQAFAFVTSNGHYDAVADPKRRGDLQPAVDAMLRHIGVCDTVHRYGWGASREHGDWGDYAHYDEVGGLEYFRGNIDRVQRSGVVVSLYLDGYLNSSKGAVAGSHAREWAMKRPDGSPQFVEAYQSYNQCPYLEGWREHLSATYARVRRDLAPNILYIDEIGSTDGRWMCHAQDHGHSGGEIPYAGETVLLRAIREAAGPETALYTEYPPAEVSRQYLDGSITYQALWSAGEERLAPHFIDLPRFAFPRFKQFHIIHYVPHRAGNWWLLKFPFFNGEVYRVGEPSLPGMDEPSLAFLRKAIRIQCAHRNAFAAVDVEPLVPVAMPGVFANRFTGSRETAWTLYNANGRTVRGALLRVTHAPGATYEDAWNGAVLTPALDGGDAVLSLELGPKAVGCVVQRKGGLE